MPSGIGTDNDNSQASWALISPAGQTLVARRITFLEPIGVTGPITQGLNGTFTQGWWTRLTDGMTGPVKVERAGTFATPLASSDLAMTSNARVHQQWSSSHDLTPSADNNFYPQFMNTLGDLITDFASLKGVRVDTNSGNKSAGTQRVVIATDQPAVPISIAAQLDTELPAAAALADSTANPTAPAVAAHNMGWNGTTWDRDVLAQLYDLNGTGTNEYAVSVTPRMLNASGTAKPWLLPSNTVFDATQAGGIVWAMENEPHSAYATPSSNELIPFSVDREGSVMIVGNRFHDEADIGMPIKIGGKSNNSRPTAVSADADRVDLYVDRVGRQVTKSDWFTRSDTFTVTGNGTTVDCSLNPCTNFSVQVKGTGATATLWDVRIEGSNDNVNFTQIIAHTNADADGQTKPLAPGTFTSFPCLYFRARCAGLTLGGATNIVVTILGVP